MAEVDAIGDGARLDRERSRKTELIDGMIVGSVTDSDRRSITDALLRFPIEMLELTAEAGTRIRPLGATEPYRDASSTLRRMGVDVDMWPAPPAGLFVVEERTLYLRSRSLLTVGHEFGHAVDAALGNGIYLSSMDAEFREAFATQVAFVTPYAASGLDEAFAENLRAYVGGLNDETSFWPRATPDRLRTVAPQMSAFFDRLMVELRDRAQVREVSGIGSESQREELGSARDAQPGVVGTTSSSDIDPVPIGKPVSERGQNARRDYRQEITDKMIAAIEAGTAPWQKGWDAGDGRLPYNPTTGKAYRGGNTLRLLLEGHADPRWMTYKQAQSEGWQVRRGERGTTIEYWKFERAERPKSDASAAGEQPPNAAAKSDEVDERLRPRVFYATVFNADQIDGVPPLERATHQWDVSERAEQFADALGFEIRYGGDRAFYRPDAEPNVINLPARDQFVSAAAFYDTLFHEAAHWTGHRDRLDRDLTGRFGSESYAKEELRAEIAGAFIAAELGIPRDADNNAAYVASWVQVLRNDKNEIFRAATSAQQIADFVFERALERVHDAGIEPDGDGQLTNPQTSVSPLSVFEPAAWEIVADLEQSGDISQTITILGRSEDGSRIYGRDGGLVLSVPATTFDADRSPRDGETVRVSRLEGVDRIDRAVEPSTLEVAR